jgi:predicted nucleic acid-binding protein
VRAAGSPFPRRVLIDSAAYYAILDQQERTHPQAATTLNQLAVERWRLFTTNFIVAEAHALILGRLGYYHATQFLRQFEAGATTVLRVTQADEERARRVIYQYHDKRFSMTDATSFVIMERHRIGVAFTFDHNFVQYGHQTLGM